MKEKTAEEMFKELGFKKHISSSGLIITYKNNEGYYTSSISFDDGDQYYMVLYFDNDSGERIGVMITKELHKAITKQMEELGWL